MRGLYIDCPNGLAGDMLLAALYDLGVPKDIIEKPLHLIGLGKYFNLNFKEMNSYNFRGIQTAISFDLEDSARNWKDIKKIIRDSNWQESLKEKVYNVFFVLAEAESIVHGVDIEKVHFHEIGAIDCLVDIIGFCAAIEFLNPSTINCRPPEIGAGYVKTAHGDMPVPVPAVLEIARKNEIVLSSNSNQLIGELSTPTGMAIAVSFVDKFELRNIFEINSYGVGFGSRDINRPNYLRILDLNIVDKKIKREENENIQKEEVLIQEAWIDDSSAEQIAFALDHFLNIGALDVSSSPIQMKKGRLGANIQVIINKDDEYLFRNAWFSHTSTIGFRQRLEKRWVLKREIGKCQTVFGEVGFKRIFKSDGSVIMKPENDDVIRICKQENKGWSNVYDQIQKSKKKFQLYKKL